MTFFFFYILKILKIEDNSKGIELLIFKHIYYLKTKQCLKIGSIKLRFLA